jgi:toxin ParE1/3/4
MVRVDITEPAAIDIEDIWNYVASQNEPAANRLVRKFTQVFSRIARMPGLGEEYGSSLPGTRILTSGAYVIIYVVRQDRIQISRILHSARDWQSLLDDSETSEE